MRGRLMDVLRFCCVGGAALAAAGCAFHDQSVALTYEPTAYEGRGAGEVSLVRPAEPELETKDSKGKTVVVIGNVKNTYGATTADAVTEQSLGEWVAGALELELSRAGYQPRIVDARPPAGRSIEVTIVRAWVDQDPGFFTVGAIGNLILNVSLSEDGERSAEFLVESIGQGERGLMGGAGTKGAALAVALRECMHEAMVGIDRYFGARP
jgi:hypothetical protein